MTLTGKKKNVLRQKITEAINATVSNIADLKELTKPIPPENAIGRVSRMDAINNKSVNEEVLRKAEEKLNKLNYALTKVGEPTFGICTRCGQSIPEGRLMLMPQSVMCVNCAK